MTALTVCAAVRETRDLHHPRSPRCPGRPEPRLVYIYTHICTELGSWLTQPRHSDNNTNSADFWDHKDFQDRVVWLWEQLAEHYKDYACIAGYNPLNEPCDPSKSRPVLSHPSPLHTADESGQNTPGCRRSTTAWRRQSALSIRTTSSGWTGTHSRWISRPLNTRCRTACMRSTTTQ